MTGAPKDLGSEVSDRPVPLPVGSITAHGQRCLREFGFKTRPRWRKTFSREVGQPFYVDNHALFPECCRSRLQRCVAQVSGPLRINFEGRTLNSPTFPPVQSAVAFAGQVRETFLEERELGMVETHCGTAARMSCSCRPEELCPGPWQQLMRVTRFALFMTGLGRCKCAHPKQHCGKNRSPYHGGLRACFALA